MTTNSTTMRFHVASLRVDVHGSNVLCKQANIALDTDLAGNPNAFNPAELLLAALSACMIKGIERVVLILNYKIIVDTRESDQRLSLLHEHAKKYGTVFSRIGLSLCLSPKLMDLQRMSCTMLREVTRALEVRGVGPARLSMESFGV